MAGFDDAYDKKIMRQNENLHQTIEQTICEFLTPCIGKTKQEAVEFVENIIGNATKGLHDYEVVCDKQINNKEDITDGELNVIDLISKVYGLDPKLTKELENRYRLSKDYSLTGKTVGFNESDKSTKEYKTNLVSEQTNGYLVSWHNNNQIEYDFVPDDDLPPYQDQNKIDLYLESVCPDNSKYVRAYSSDNTAKGVQKLESYWLTEESKQSLSKFQGFVQDRYGIKNKKITTIKSSNPSKDCFGTGIVSEYNNETVTIEANITRDGGKTFQKEYIKVPSKDYLERSKHNKYSMSCNVEQLKTQRKVHLSEPQEGFFVVWDNAGEYAWDFQAAFCLPDADAADIELYVKEQYPNDAQVYKGRCKHNNKDFPEYTVFYEAISNNLGENKNPEELHKFALFCQNLRNAMLNDFKKPDPCDD